MHILEAPTVPLLVHVILGVGLVLPSVLLPTWKSIGFYEFPIAQF